MTPAISSFTCASVMANKAYVLYPNAAVAPRATRVSIFGDRRHRLLNPLIKNFWFITITATVRSSCNNPWAMRFCSKKEGTGQSHIICPMEKYIRTSKKTRDADNLLFKTGVSLSSRKASSFSRLPFSVSAPRFFDAPYPALTTAAITASSEAVPSTPMELVKRLTVQEVTPSTFPTAFSTRALHAAQLIPVTVYCSMFLPPCSFNPHRSHSI